MTVPWTARRLNQLNLKESNSVYSLEGLMLKLKLQYFGQLMERVDSIEKILMLGKTEGKRRLRQKLRQLDSIRLNGQEFEQTPGDSEEGLGILVCCSPWDHRVGHDLATNNKN